MKDRLECACFAYLPGGCVVGGLLAVWWKKWWEATLEGCDGALCKGLPCLWGSLDLVLLEMENHAAAGCDLFPFVERSLWRVLRGGLGGN